MAVEIATCIATTMFDYSIGTIVKHFGYLVNHRKNMANLKAQVVKLDDVRDDKSHSVLVAQRNAERIRSRVESWQNDADKITLEARSIMEEYEENAKKRCLMGLSPNLVSDYRLSRKACKKQLEIDEAMTEADKFDGVSDRVVRRTTSIVSTEGYFAFDSRKSTLEEIVKALQDASKNLIGVYGLGGMGKTTLVKQVASQVAEEKMFDEIVMALVAHTPDLREVQGQIANKLDLELEESSVAERAGRINKRLKDKKVLVILDDLWEALDLERVGIPFGAQHMGCKILLTSRFQSVLSSMGTKRNFHLGALEEKEAWRLFEEKTINCVKDPALLAIGLKVAKRCEGLPVLIVTVAASLSSRPCLAAWKDALNQLENMNNKEMHEIVNSAMEFISYKHLEETHKRLFLLCGLIGSVAYITDLLKYCWGWGLLEDAVTIEEARNKVDALILDLKASCLLLDGDSEDNVKMHDVVRGVAMSIARKDLNMFTVGDNDAELNKWPKDDVLNKCTAMVVHVCRKLPCLPERLDCPLLEFFFLTGFSMDTPPAIPDTYFERTRELKVLDMSGLYFSALPSSLSFLQNLQTLCVEHCNKLEDISIVEELKKLQVLSFAGSNIEELTKGIGQLSELRLLDLSRCSELKVIPPGLIAGLSQLEELYMMQSFNRWEGEVSLSSSGRSNASLAELEYMRNLRSLEIEVPNAKLLPDKLSFDNLERYTIIVGDMPVEEIVKELDKKGISRKIGVQLDTSINHLQHGIQRLLKISESLCLRKLNGIKNVIHELDTGGFSDLKHLDIQTDYDIQYIINVESLPKQHKAFPALESLRLSNLLKLKKYAMVG